MASTLLAPAQLRMAKLALSMHTTSPTVRMFDQVATQNNAKDVQCEAFVAIASLKVCDNDALKDTLKSFNKYKPVSMYSTLTTLYNTNRLIVAKYFDV